MTTEFGTNDAQTVKVWSAESVKETFGQMTLKPLIGSNPGAAFIRKGDLSRGAGDEIRYDLLKLNRTAGVSGDAQLAGYESDLDYAQDIVRINQKREAHAYRRMSQQRTLYRLREDAKYVLSEWAAWGMEAGMFAHLAGTVGDGPENAGAFLEATQGQADFAGNTIGISSSVAIDADHTVDGTAGAFNLQLIDTMKAKAQDINPRMPMIKIGGESKYILYIDNRQERSLKTAAGDGSWNLIQQRASARGKSNPIYSGALGEYNGVIIRSSEFVPRVSTVSHGIMIGASAGVFALGNAWDEIDGSEVKGSYFRMNEDTFDYGNKKGMALAMMAGFKRCEFDSKAYGVMTVTTTEPAL